MKKLNILKQLIIRNNEIESIYLNQDANRKYLLQTRIELLKQIKELMENSINDIEEALDVLDYDQKSNDDVAFDTDVLFDFLEEKMEESTQERYSKKEILIETNTGEVRVYNTVEVLAPTTSLNKLNSKTNSYDEVYSMLKKIITGDDILVSFPIDDNEQNKNTVKFLENIKDYSNGINIINGQLDTAIVHIGGIHFEATDKIIKALEKTGSTYGVNFTDKQYNKVLNKSSKNTKK